MVTRAFLLAILFLTILKMNAVCQVQASNLLRNPNADTMAASWRASGEAMVERTAENDLSFVVRNGGHFYQDVELPTSAAGQYALLVGRGSSERINLDGSITGLPYLYGYMMEKGRPDGKEIRDYLQGERMLGRSTIKDEWVQMWGIFKVPQGTNTIRLFLQQALQNGVPHNGSAARFDDLGLYLFVTRADAGAFVQSLGSR